MYSPWRVNCITWHVRVWVWDTGYSVWRVWIVKQKVCQCADLGHCVPCLENVDKGMQHVTGQVCLESVDSGTWHISVQVWDPAWRVWIVRRGVLVRRYGTLPVDCLEIVDSGTLLGDCGSWDIAWIVWIVGHCLESVDSGTLLGDCG